MEVGAIGGGMAMGGAAGLGGPGAAGAADAAGPAVAGTESLEGGVAPGGAPPPTTVGEALAGMHTGVEQLAELLEGFSIAEIIIAMMLAAGTQKKDDEQSCGGAAAGFHAKRLGQPLELPEIRLPNRPPERRPVDARLLDILRRRFGILGNDEPL